MGYMDMLKKYVGTSKTSNLYQNPDLIEELGYPKQEEPAQPKDEKDKASPDTKPTVTKTPPEEKPTEGMGGTRG